MNPANQELILIVDDHHTNLKVLFNVLKNAGFKVLVAKDGESALEKLQEVLPDLILLDIKMPGIDGFETCHCIKSSVKTQNIPVIFMTALNEAVDKVKGLSLGAVDYITKPFEQEEVLARVRMHLKLSALTKKLEAQNELLKQEIEARKGAETALSNLTQQLEQRVLERTAELTHALNALQKTQIQLLEREAKLGHDAVHDSLTNLPNRTWFVARLKHTLRLAKQYPDLLHSVLFIDLDRFKVVNDSLGHLVGDELLKSVACRLQASLRHTDTVARFGGDEFVILLENIQEFSEAIHVAERILEQVKQPFQVNGYEVFSEVSIGIILNLAEYERPEDVLRDADAAMYQAKAKGRGRYEVFDPAMQTMVMARLQLENDLRRAVAQQELCLHYQPIVSLSTLEVVGFEALVRWYHSSQGWISPGQFIPVAEETRLINEIGWWVLQQACHQLNIWHRQFPDKLFLSMNVNFSAVQIKQVELLQKIETILQNSEIPQHSLKLEITESSIVETVGCEAKTLKHFKNLGIQLCIDDFGTGYSSLSRLHEFPIDTLKIDRSFVKRIEPDHDDIEIVKTIVTLARSRGMDVVAEGIETLFQLSKLKQLNCDYGQGYLFSAPVDSQTATQFLENTKIFHNILS
jgi:diguanylate cyclase (GGDEF)-like protein